MKKEESHIVQGLSRDASVEQFDNKYVYDAHNIRITSVNGNQSLLSVTNEKGTLDVNLTGVTGNPIGYAVYGQRVILFTTENDSDSPVYNSTYTGDHIYDIEITGNTCTSKLLFEGSLCFSDKHRIETIPVYENDSIQKVYWTDGYNQPRMIKLDQDSYTDDEFDFVRKVNISHTMTVTKNNTGGEFPAGTIQYAFSYYNKFKQQTKIVDYSPLYYLSPSGRGLAADKKASCSFNIFISGLDLSFDYLRLYSIVRTTADAVPQCRIVGDYRITSNDDVTKYYRTGLITQSQRFIGSYKNLVLLDNTFTKIKNLTDLTPVLSQTYGYYLVCTPGTGYLYDTETGIAFSTETNISVFYSLDTVSYTIMPSQTVDGKEVNSGTVSYGTISSRGKNSIEITDNGIIGETVSATSLPFVGGEEITAGTIAQKDNTLFLGNVHETRPNIGTLEINNVKLSDWFHNNVSALSRIVVDYYGNVNGAAPNPSLEAFYDYNPDNNRNSQQVKRFKYGENYRLGIIAQYRTGEWSEAVWIDDADQLIMPALTYGSYLTGAWKFTIDKSVVNLLLSAGYERVAPVVVYPTLPDRRVVCQGILCPTIYNVKDRSQNSPFVQSSWQFLMYGNISDNYSIGSTTENMGNCDIQCMQDPQLCAPYARYTSSGETDRKYMTGKEFIDYFSEDYFIDTNTMTFHSPDIDSSEELLSSDFDNLQLRITGFSRTAVPDDWYNNTSKAAYDWMCELQSLGINTDHSRFIKNSVNNKALPCYADSYVKIGSVTNEEPHYDSIFGWFVYPWHRNGSLNNQGTPTTDMTKNGYTRTSVLKRKIISTLYYGITDYDYVANPISGNDLNSNPQGISITTPQLFNSDEMSAIRIPAPANSEMGSLIYYGNIDKVLIPNLVNMSNLTVYAPYPTIQGSTFEKSIKGVDKSLGYPILYGWKKYIGSSVPSNVDTTNYYKSEEELVKNYSFPSNIQEYWDGSSWNGGSTDKILYDSSKGFFGKDPISIRYKVTPHLVFSFNCSIDKDIKCLPMTKNTAATRNYYVKQYDHSPFWMDDDDISNSSYVPFKVSPYELNRSSRYLINDGSDENLMGLYIGDLYRTFSDIEMQSRFGGRTQEAFTNNEWTRCGTPQNLSKDTDSSIVFLEGDTYLERYDCLKAYPYDNNDINSVVSIYSTELETRVNLDERYDRNRGLQSNLQITPLNFNLYNHLGYEQDNNFFTYQGLDYDRYTDLYFPNLVAWTTQKTMGEDVDSWTDIDMTSTIDLDGDKGKIYSIVNYDSTLLSFQEKGIAELMFNSRVQIPTSDNEPIEITNGMKMSGTRYISNIIGCTDKWTIQETGSGLYFIDSDSGSLYRLNKGLENISLKEGMKSWFDSNRSDDMRTFYDKVNMDLYIITSSWCLVYSEQLDRFTSFMDYGGSDEMVNVGNGFYIFRKDNDNVKLWEMGQGDYNSFFGTDKSYWLTFIANSNPLYDKVFNTIEMRTMMYDKAGKFLPHNTFDTLRVFNEHQDSGNITLVDNLTGYQSNIRKRFNVWRMNVPRDAGSLNKLDRIRNTWTYITLMQSTSSSSLHQRMQFMDILVKYFL